jgi:mono/diheme cytochrome c family protein
MNTSMKIAAALLAAWVGLAEAGPAADVRHGRYLVQTSGCNDCHTPGYMQHDGKVPEAEWLTGDAMGWQGPWGTTSHGVRCGTPR